MALGLMGATPLRAYLGNAPTEQDASTLAINNSEDHVQASTHSRTRSVSALSTQKLRQRGWLESANSTTNPKSTQQADVTSKS